MQIGRLWESQSDKNLKPDMVAKELILCLAVLFLSLLAAPIHDAARAGDMAKEGKTSVVPPHVEIVGAHDVSVGGTPGLELYVGLYGSLRLPANQICVVTTKGERKCDWNDIPILPWYKTKAEILMTTLKIDDTFQMVSSVDGSAKLVTTEVGLAKLLFVGIDKSHATSFRFGPLAPVTIPNRIQDAAQDGDLGRVKLLLKGNPALASSKDDSGETALHMAAMAGHKGVVEILLAHGADVNAKDKNGDTPLRLAVIKGHKDVAQLLRQHGGHK